MDNSKEFQLMLNKAIEAHPEDFKNFDRAKNVQDQLQEMIDFPVGKFNDNFWSALDDLHKYAFNSTGEFREYIPTSMEQLWLAFLLAEKYGKVWAGEKWIKQEK